MVTRASDNPELLAWARQRAGLTLDELAHRFPRLDAWEAGDAQPTLRQLEAFANATHAPIGFLFLQRPPVEKLPLPDFRTMADKRVERPSPDLLEVIYDCERRQDWYRDFARAQRETALPFVGSLSPGSDVRDAGRQLREVLHFGVQERGSTWTDAFTRLRDQADDLGILVMVSGIVGSNTHRRLDPEEFRGFALADSLAPLVFVNGADTRAAQIFTLAHELAHVWLGQSALSDASLTTSPQNESERWCNLVAAEFLVPLESLAVQHNRTAQIPDELQRLARTYKVSTLVVLRRIYDAGYLSRREFRREYEAELLRVMEHVKEGGSGGNFYNTLPVRVSKRFARAVILSTLEGQTLHRDAFHMLGLRKHATFLELSHTLGVG